MAIAKKTTTIIFKWFWPWEWSRWQPYSGDSNWESGKTTEMLNIIIVDNRCNDSSLLLIWTQVTILKQLSFLCFFSKCWNPSHFTFILIYIYGHWDDMICVLCWAALVQKITSLLFLRRHTRLLATLFWTKTKLKALIEGTIQNGSTRFRVP